MKFAKTETVNKAKGFIIAGLILVVIGITVLLYTVFDGIKTSTSIRNVAFSFLIVGSFLSMYGKKLSPKNIKTGNKMDARKQRTA